MTFRVSTAWVTVRWGATRSGSVGCATVPCGPQVASTGRGRHAATPVLPDAVSTRPAGTDVGRSPRCLLPTWCPVERGSLGGARQQSLRIDDTNR
jgi:hypothetical protein